VEQRNFQPLSPADQRHIRYAASYSGERAYSEMRSFHRNDRWATPYVMRGPQMWHAILHFFGIIDEGGKGYAFWSGVGSDIGEVAIIGAVLGMYRKHNCHATRCWRIGKHPSKAPGSSRAASITPRSGRTARLPLTTSHTLIAMLRFEHERTRDRPRFCMEARCPRVGRREVVRRGSWGVVAVRQVRPHQRDPARPASDLINSSARRARAYPRQRGCLYSDLRIR
jgi:hypothetical protein